MRKPNLRQTLDNHAIAVQKVLNKYANGLSVKEFYAEVAAGKAKLPPSVLPIVMCSPHSGGRREPGGGERSCGNAMSE
ncbi:MAG: hypothetical protein HC935_07665 [Pseudanabaena sp. SU_2_4]|nr:hypothetical protein [Pseudanabaena sp. SU_2_4]